MDPLGKFPLAPSDNSVYSMTYPEDKQAALGGEATWYHTQFDAFREMYKARDFQLVLKASNVSDDSVRELKCAVAAEKARGGLPPQLSVTYTLRTS
jgi:hypothetical protein